MRGLASAPNFSQNQIGYSPSGKALAALSHVQAIEANYFGALTEDRFVKGEESHGRIKADSMRIVEILERGGIEARLPRAVSDLGSVTGVVEMADSLRNTNVIPLIASRNRRGTMYELSYYICNELKYPARYAVLTAGQRKEIYSDMRGDMQAFHRKISKIAHWAKHEYGINFIFRADELPFDETLTFHLHANVLYWQTRPMSAVRWDRFIREMGAKLGARWKDNGPVKDVAEVVKYLSKGDDLTLLADLACTVPEWADREVPQAQLIETIATRISYKRSSALKRRVSPDECYGFAVSVVREAVEFFRQAAAEGKPHPLVWLFHELYGLHLVQPSGEFQAVRNLWKNDNKKVHLHRAEDGSKYLRLKERNSVPKGRVDRNEPLTDEEKVVHEEISIIRKMEERENQILCVTMPSPRFSPWSEEVIKVENLTFNPKTEAGALGLWRIQQLQEKARRRWDRAGSPDPAYALSVAAAIRAEASRGDPAPAGGSCSPCSGGVGGGEAVAPLSPHNNDNCPQQNTPHPVQRRVGGALVKAEASQVVFRPPSIDEICALLDVDGALRRAAEVQMKPEPRSLWWKLRNYELWRLEEMENSDNSELCDGDYINTDRKNFSVIEWQGDECDIPF